ncbi:MAG: creatininase family protein [Halobacteriota archaeon]
MVFDTIGRSGVDWAGMTYRDVSSKAKQDGSILIVPVGSLEQHGHHLPTATDTILVDAVVHGGAKAVAEEIPVLVTPPIWTGFSAHHLPVGGTVSIDHSQLIDILSSVADTAAENGFDALFFVNGHGGNAAAVSCATEAVGASHPDLQVLGTTYFDLGSDRIDAIRKSDHGGAGHAGEVETSMILYLRPELVRESDVTGTPWETEYDRTRADLTVSGPLSVYLSFDEMSETGSVGEPEAASAENGKLFYEVFVDEIETVIRRAHDAAISRTEG